MSNTGPSALEQQELDDAADKVEVAGRTVVVGTQSRNGGPPIPDAVVKLPDYISQKISAANLSAQAAQAMLEAMIDVGDGWMVENGYDPARYEQTTPGVYTLKVERQANKNK